MTRVSDVMTRGVRTLSPHDSLAHAARAMQELDIGVVPVCEGERLVGMVTDRDLVVRGIARGRPVEHTLLDEVMSRDPRWCFEDQAVDEVLEQMRDARVRRVPVLDHAHHLVGMLSLGDVALKADGDGAGIVLQEVSEPDRAGGRGQRAAAGRATGARGPGATGTSSPRGDAGTAPDSAGSPRPEAAPGADAEAAAAPLPLARTGARPLEIEPRMGNKTIWVLVADEAIARILQWPEHGDELDPVEELTDPAAHARDGDFQRDASGRRAGSATHGARQNTAHRLRGTASVTSSAGDDAQHLEAQSFARRVAQHLAEARRQHRFDELRIVAAPRFLGHLRKELDPHVAAAVTDELNKDLVHMTSADITQRLFRRRDDEPT